jgi:hypothetical protein
MTAGDAWALHSPLLFSVHSLTRTSLQIWRLFTCVLFYGKLGFPFLTWLYFLYSYSLRLEQEHFSRRTADYIYAMLIVWVIMLVIGYVFDQMVRYMAIVAFLAHVHATVSNPPIELLTLTQPRSSLMGIRFCF